MKGITGRALAASLALAMIGGPVLAVTAEAGPKQRRGDRRVERRYDRGDRRHDRGDRHYGKRYESRHRGGHRRADRHHRDRRVVVHRDVHHHHRGSGGIVPFLGGVAIGAIIGSQHSCPPPPPRRVYVYDCGYCDGTYRDYGIYLDHLVVYHHIDRCDIERYHPMYAGGYWEGY